MQKHVNLVDLVKSFPTNIFLQNLASIQKRTSLIKFDHLAEKSEKGSTSNLSTKVQMGETTALGEWRKHMDERKREIQMRHNTALRTDSLSDLHVSSLLQTP